MSTKRRDGDTCVWYSDADGIRYREGDEVFYVRRGKTLRCTVLMFYIDRDKPMVCLGSTAGTLMVDAEDVRVWPNGR